MARSEYVYVVQRWDRVVAAFTVKKELVKWLGKTRVEDVGFGLQGVQVARVSDGDLNPLRNTILDIAELLEGA